MSFFPILDAPRNVANAEHNRVIMDSFGHVEAFVEEVDSWCALPIRLVHDQAAGFAIEVGPYSLDRASINVLRAAIAAYDEARGDS